MQTTQKILLSAICLLFFFELIAQEYIVNVRQFGVEDGLSHRIVNSVFQDTSGFIWIGTENSFQRFDGYKFKSILEPGGKNLQGVHRISKVHEAQFWLYSEKLKEFYIFNPVTEDLHTLEEIFGSDFSDEMSSGEASWDQNAKKNHQDKDGNFYFGLNSEFGEILVFDGKSDFRKIEVPSTKQLDILLIDQTGFIWARDFDNENTLLKISQTGQIIEKYSGILNLNTLLNLIEDKSGNIYFSDLRGFHKINNKGKLKSILKTPGNSINGFHEDLAWTLGSEGWKIVSLSGKTVFELNRSEYDKKLFDGINGVVSAGRGRVIIYGQFGFNIVEYKKNKFTNYFSKSMVEELPFNNSGRGIFASGDTLWTNFEFGGLVEMKKSTSSNFNVLDTPPDDFWDIHNKKNNYYGRPIIRNRDNDFWIGHVEEIVRWNASFSEKEHFPFSGKSYQNTWSLYVDKSQCIWAGTGYELAYKCPEEKDFNFFQNQDTMIQFDLPDNPIYNLIPEGENLLWLCAEKRLYTFDLEQRKLLGEYWSGGENEYYLPVDGVNHLQIDSAGNKWLATGSGLIFWDTKTGEKRLFTQNEGLSNEDLRMLFEDEHGYLWIGSAYGIMQFSKAQMRVINTFFPKDGTAYPEVNPISGYRDEEGRIYFGGYNGLTAFDPNDFYNEKIENLAPVAITDFKQFDGSVNKLVNKSKEILKEQTIILRPEDRYFQLEFALLNFEEIYRNYYGWKVEGVDDDWIYQSENVIQSGRLPYGEHILRVKGQGSDGVWSPKELRIKVLVLKPFYLKTWFLVLSSLGLVAGIFVFLKWRIYRFRENQKLLEKEIKTATAKIKAQAEELRQLDKVKSRFFANVSHELRTPLTLMLGPISSALKSGTLSNRNFTFLKRAEQGGMDLIKLVGSILDLSKMESSKMELQEAPEILFNLTRRIVSAFESHAQREGIKFEFQFKAEKDLRLNLDKEKIETILNNLLSNALKFTPKGGKISVKIEDLGRAIKITVADTGRGIHPDDLPFVFDRFYQTKQPGAATEGGTGIGLALSQEFAKLMNGHLRVESELGKGSDFVFEFPRMEVLGMAEERQTADGGPQTAESGANELAEPASFHGLLTDDLNYAANLRPSSTVHRLPSILIVEDNHSLRDYLKSILEINYEVLIAENGKVALNILVEPISGNRQPDIVISDIMMPVMDGYQLLQAIKTTESLQHLPVIMLTARADMQDKLKALRIGVDDYLLKPFEEDELLVRIENLLKNYESRKAFLSKNEGRKTSENNRPKISPENQKWLETVESTLMTKIENSNYSLLQMTSDFAMSESTFTRQLKRFTGLTPVRYLQELRLNEARRILENHEHRTIAEVAYKIGFSDAKAFSRAFKKRFGKSPSDLINN